MAETTEAPAPLAPPFSVTYQYRRPGTDRSERAVYGMPDREFAEKILTAHQPSDPATVIEQPPTIVRFEDLSARDQAEFATARGNGKSYARYCPDEPESQPKPPATVPTHTPSSYAEYVARREARLARKAKNYGEWAESREKKAEAAFKKEHAILNMIPLGQPILVGHHSERRHRRDLDRADNLMRKGIEHADMAKKHAYKSDACAAALDRQTDPGFCQRRIDEAEAGIRKCERELLYCKVRKSEQASIDHWNLWLGRYQEQKAFWSARLESVGGPRVTVADIKKGDSIRYRGEGFCEVIRVNKKTVTAMVPAGRQMWEMKIPISDILEVKRAAGGA